MPRTFEMAADYGDSVEQIYRAFSDEGYWRARLAESGADECDLTYLAVSPTDGVDVRTIQTIFKSRLPGLVQGFHSGDLSFVREEVWTPLAGGTATASISGSIPGAPASLSGTATLTAAGAGAQLRVTATVTVKIPLIGGTVEGFVAEKLSEFLSAEEGFTSAWVREHPDVPVREHPDVPVREHPEDAVREHP